MKFGTIFRLSIFTAYFMSIAMVTAQAPPAAPPAQPAAQPATPKTPYDSTKAQLAVTKEENLQLKASALTSEYQKQLGDMRAQFADLDKQIQEWSDQVRKDNGWDATYQYDRQKDQWTHTPPAPKVEEKKPEPKK